MKLRRPIPPFPNPLRPQCHHTASIPSFSRTLITSTATSQEKGLARQPTSKSSIKALIVRVPQRSKSSSSASSTADIDEFTRDYTPFQASLSLSRLARRPPDPHHLHVYCHRHNTRVTLTRPDHSTLITVTAGHLGFKKAKRGSYDAGFQVGKYATERIHEQGLLRDIQRLVIVWRDFGKGREAIQKVLLGNEGRALRKRLVSVVDATRIKFGGTKGEKARRLG